jgi:hypothetical protein
MHKIDRHTWHCVLFVRMRQEDAYPQDHMLQIWPPLLLAFLGFHGSEVGQGESLVKLYIYNVNCFRLCRK